MCTIIFAYKMHPGYDLIYLGNRDEYKDRAFERGRIKDGLLMGIDLEKMGTWFGISHVGKLAFLTNYRDFNLLKDHPTSRGHLVKDYLSNKTNKLTYLEKLKETRGQYNPYNIVYGTLSELIYYGSVDDTHKVLEPGIYGLSNGKLDEGWPKVISGKKQLTDILYDEIIDLEGLFEILNNPYCYSDNLPNTIEDRLLEKKLSAMHVDFDNYGTVCKQIVLVDKRGKVSYFEKVIDDGFKSINKQVLRMSK